MLFSDIFLSRWWSGRGDPLTDITRCKRRQGSTQQTERVSQRAGGRQLRSTNNSSSNINKISVFGKGKYYFQRTQKTRGGGVGRKIVKVNVIIQIKELWLLALDLAKEKFWGFKEISNLSFKSWNLYLGEIIFVTNFEVLKYSTYLDQEISSAPTPRTTGKHLACFLHREASPSLCT